MKLSLERNERLSAQIKNNEDADTWEHKPNDSISGYKNDLAASNNEVNQLKQQVQVAMQISAEEKQASKDAIATLNGKLNVRTVC